MGLDGILLVSILMFSFHGIYCSRDIPTSSLYSISANSRYYGSFDGEEKTPVIDNVAGMSGSNVVINVESYGARGDGSDATKAFLNAWSKLCSSSSPAVLMVPANKNYLLKPIEFYGPCKSAVTVTIQGTIQASSDRSDWNEENERHWILFQGVNNLRVGGGGTINGNGQIWWKNSCKIDKSLPCKVAPTALWFYSCNNLVVENLNVKNSQQIHLEFEGCTNVVASSLTIQAPGDSPNTDGIHIATTRNISLDHCNIATGDDCISIVTGSQIVRATNIYCGPGHGISIGSLGAHNSEDHVSDVIVDTVHLKGTTNGLRIKTWQGGRGYAKNIHFQNVDMNNVQNPIIIDQKYCDSDKPCGEQKSAVQVSDVSYKNIKGTSASEVAIAFECSKSFPCQGIVLQDINLVKAGGGSAKSTCANAKWTKKGTVNPSPCA